MRIARYPAILLKKGDEVLLGLNKKGFSKNKWTLFGGFLQRKETLLDAAIRYLKEQSGITVEKAEKIGKIEVKFGGVQELIQIHVFLAETFTGEPIETREVLPKWFNLGELPISEMWSDVPFWFDQVAGGKRVKAFFIYENETLLYQDVDSPPPPPPLQPTIQQPTAVSPV
ncbi:hypothetical protein AAG570_005419 [Ranatra chinensis]|uniref:Oxidized purine nucleoside triphosphate hydrolase n=1 Tax=Ranatra chinensis TaxID=642074 RepID=A0ABD0YFS5_9HEMI